MEQSSSPGTNPVELSNSIEELLKFTLQSHLNGTLELDIGLSKQFCSSLLNHPSTSPISLNASSSSEASQNPLYKQLARALYEIITFGSLQESSDCNKVASFCQGSDLKQKDEWFDLVHKEGSELAEILKNINFELHVQEPFFTQLKDGIKAVEGRCAVGDYNRYASKSELSLVSSYNLLLDNRSGFQIPIFASVQNFRGIGLLCTKKDRIATGALILFNKCLVLEVQDVHYYASFFEMLEAESLAKVLPGVKTIDEGNNPVIISRGGVQVYRKFYTEEKEKTNGVAAICVAKMAAQPYLSLARILSEIIQRQKESELLMMLQHRAWMSQHIKQNTQRAICHWCRDTGQRMSRHSLEDTPK
ncbi:hypothetical protein Goarm_011059 [Gossypium armourianum]|uniref:ASCH domain-containing protein n=1 Tax=Gossypium armourianum TaxID=34283 RepID=A0A7J9IYB3_9ROSI|nr:hypothetical protein [Gossypium armourianum]